MAEPLFKKFRDNTFPWGQDAQKAFATLKEALTTTPVLGIPTATDPFILDTDASHTAVAAELLQIQGGGG